MATYFMFGIYDTDALEEISAERTQKVQRLIEAAGGKIKTMYVLMGDQDLVLITEFPDEKAAIQASIRVSKLTGIAFSTTPALEVSEFDQLMSGG